MMTNLFSIFDPSTGSFFWIDLDLLLLSCMFLMYIGFFLHVHMK